MVRGTQWIAALSIAAAGVVAAAGGRRGAEAVALLQAVERTAACASNLGQGVKTSRYFCDVIVAPTGKDSVSMTIPAHAGASTLHFQLHPRFEVPPTDETPAVAYRRQTAFVAVVGPTGTVIDQAAVSGEFRVSGDLFDRMTGAGPGGLKVVAPGAPVPVRVVIPANVSAIGIVGLRVVVETRFGQRAFPEQGQPVAIVSDWRIEYRAR
jgi:hypothetical protein